MNSGSSAVEYFKALLEATKKEEEKQNYGDESNEFELPEDDNPFLSLGGGFSTDQKKGLSLDQQDFSGGTEKNGGKNVSLPALWDFRETWDENDLPGPDEKMPMWDTG